jgi:hypothetical protein
VKIDLSSLRPALVCQVITENLTYHVHLAPEVWQKSPDATTALPGLHNWGLKSKLTNFFKYTDNMTDLDLKGPFLRQ